jgi:hypothetical protein
MKKPQRPLVQRFFHDMFTGRDNHTFDMGRILWFQSIQAFIGLSVYALYKGGTFDPVLWGAGLAALMASGGAALGLKSGTEPEFREKTPMGDFSGRIDAVRTEVTSVRQSATSMAASKPDEPDDGV